MDQIAQCLDLNPNRFCLLGALLGNHILTPADLAEFHARLAPEATKAKKAAAANNAVLKPADFAKIIRAVVNYIRTLPTIDEVDQIGKDAFGSENDPRVRKLRNSIKYFKAGLKESSRSKGRRVQKGKKYVPIRIGDADEEDLEVEEGATSAARAKPKVDKQKSESEIVERIALDFDQLDLNRALADVQASAEAEAAPEARQAADEELSVVQALASGMKVTPSADGKVSSLMIGIPQPC